MATLVHHLEVWTDLEPSTLRHAALIQEKIKYAAEEAGHEVVMNCMDLEVLELRASGSRAFIERLAAYAQAVGGNVDHIAVDTEEDEAYFKASPYTKNIEIEYGG